jgi:DNA mismatch endonuclease (patch repair protein)
MAAIRRRDTRLERTIRSLLHAGGLRFRVDFPIRVGEHRPIRPDVVFTRQRVAVFCDGCFWHGCADHGQRPQIAHASYWRPKIAGNMDRDLHHTAVLQAAGWLVLRFWEHEDPASVTASVAAAVRARTDQPR